MPDPSFAGIAGAGLYFPAGSLILMPAVYKTSLPEFLSTYSPALTGEGALAYFFEASVNYFIY